MQADDVMSILRAGIDYTFYQDRYYPAGLEMRRYLTTTFSFKTLLDAFLP
jgi:hypothetical protein